MQAKRQLFQSQTGGALPQPSVLGSKSRWGKSTCDQPEIAEQAHSHTSFQDGVDQDCERYNTKGRLDDKTEFEGCIPLDPHLSISPEIPPVPNMGSTMAVQGPPFGLSSAPCTFTKLLKPVVANMRKLGSRTILYLDDMLIPLTTNSPTEQITN